MSISRIKKQELTEYRSKLQNGNWNLGEDALMLVKENRSVGACYVNREHEAGFDVSGSAIAAKGALVASPLYSAVIVSKPHYASICIESGESLPAVLDDMAQIVGSSVEIVPGDRHSIAAAIKRCSAVMTTAGELLTYGRTLYEAYTCLMVTEKNAEIYVKSAVLGGATPINKYLAAGEHIFYLKKYSAAENKRQKKLEGAVEKPAEDSADSIKASIKSAVKNKAKSVASAAGTGVATIYETVSESIAEAESVKDAVKSIASSAHSGFKSIKNKAATVDDAATDNNTAEKNAANADYTVAGIAADNSHDLELEKFKEQFNPFKLNEGELVVASTIIDYGKQLLEADLVQGTWGNLSVKLDDTYMLCTPSGLDYKLLKPEDIIKVNYHTLEYDSPLKPTSEKGLHGGIYRSREDVGAIIHTHSKYCSIFAACDTALETSEGAEVNCAKYALSGTEALAKYTYRALGHNSGCFLSHHGMIAIGADLREAYKNCATIELTAENYINKEYEKSLAEAEAGTHLPDEVAGAAEVAAKAGEAEVTE